MATPERSIYPDDLTGSGDVMWKRAESNALGNMAYVLWHVGEHERSLACAEEAIERGRGLGIGAETRFEINAARALHYVGRIPEAVDRLRHAAAVCREIGVPFYLT